jgi:hypothetical protein
MTHRRLFHVSLTAQRQHRMRRASGFLWMRPNAQPGRRLRFTYLSAGLRRASLSLIVSRSTAGLGAGVLSRPNTWRSPSPSMPSARGL